MGRVRHNGNDPRTGDPLESLLFIEDDDGIRLALSLALEDEGYSVREAANGADGLAAFDQRAPDLVLLDLRLPDMSGFDVCRSIRARSIVPIIIITAQTDTHDMVAGLAAGADDYITKPVVPKELAARIRALLEERGAGEGVRHDRQGHRRDQRDHPEQEADLGAQAHRASSEHVASVAGGHRCR